jgi:hypothetical protein
MADTSATAFKKVIGGILSYNVESHPWKALVAQDVTDIDSFMALGEDDIKDLTYQLDDGTAFHLTVGHRT